MFWRGKKSLFLDEAEVFSRGNRKTKEERVRLVVIWWWLGDKVLDSVKYS